MRDVTDDRTRRIAIAGRCGRGRQLASTINEQIVAAVRKEVSAIVVEARAAHTAMRTLFLQNVLDTREADKREFVFLS